MRSTPGPTQIQGRELSLPLRSKREGPTPEKHLSRFKNAFVGFVPLEIILNQENFDAEAFAAQGLVVCPVATKVRWADENQDREPRKVI